MGRPAVRALVIGVGAYPWLVGGAEARDAAVTEGMAQLVSPPISARAFADWVATECWHPAREVATIDLLLSDRDGPDYLDPGGIRHAVERADKAAVKAAVRRWKDSGGPNDLLLFFFCGHGVAAGFDVALLASDYGSDNEQPFDGAFSLDGLVENMRGARTERQVFFVDACRVASAGLLRSQHVYRADPLIGTPIPMNQAVRQAVYFSTLRGQPAFGRLGQVSLFTAALLRSLRGAAASDNEGEWAIETSMLQRSLNFFLDELADPIHGQVQTPQTGTQSVFELVRTRSAPIVPLMLRSGWHEGEDPPDEIRHIEISREDGEVASWRHPWEAGGSVTWAPNRFATDLEAGWRYTCTVAFEHGPSFVSRARNLGPPYCIVEIRRDGDA